MTSPAPETDVEDFVIAYLVAQSIAPAAQISADMPATPALPFVLVTRVAGGDDFVVDMPTVDLDFFDATKTAASDIARAGNHVMRQLIPKVAVTMPDSSIVNPYGPTKVDQTPIFVPWEPSGGGAVMARYVGRYRLRLRLPSISF